MPRKTVIFSLIYVLFVVWAFFFVRSILRTEPLFTKDNTKPKIAKIWTVSATVMVNTGTNTISYKGSAKNTDTVMSFLEDLRHAQGLIFEKRDFSHGVEIDTLFGSKAPDGYRWAMSLNGTDITNALPSTEIVDKAVYEINLVKK